MEGNLCCLISQECDPVHYVVHCNHDICKLQHKEDAFIRPGLAVPSKIQSLHAQIKMRVAGVSACSSLRKGPYGLAESASDFPQPD